MNQNINTEIILLSGFTNASFQTDVSNLLKSRGYNVKSAANSWETINRPKTENIKIVILGSPCDPESFNRIKQWSSEKKLLFVYIRTEKLQNDYLWAQKHGIRYYAFHTNGYNQNLIDLLKIMLES